MHFTLILLLTLNIVIVTALQCYQCRSDVHKRCDENLSKSFLQDCNETTTTAPQTASKDQSENNVDGTGTSGKTEKSKSEKPPDPDAGGGNDPPAGGSDDPAAGGGNDPAAGKGGGTGEERAPPEPDTQFSDADEAEEKDEDEGGMKYCRKIQQSLYIRKNNEMVTIRECAGLESSESCDVLSNKMLYISVCTCTGDACNAAPKINVLSPFLFILFVLISFSLI